MYPSINGIELRNYEVVQDTYFQKHVKGDIYYKGKLSGYYNPCYFVGGESMPQVLVRVDNDTELYEYASGKLSEYHSILDYKETIIYIDGKPEKQSGLKVLLQDLELLIQLYEIMRTTLTNQKPELADLAFLNFGDEGLIGLMNNNTIQMIKCQPGTVLVGDVDRSGILKNITEHSNLKLDANYPTLLFLSELDFGIHTDILQQ